MDTLLLDNNSQLLIERGDNPYRPCIENRVAFQFETDGDLLGHWNGEKKNRITLHWLAEGLKKPPADGESPHAVLDVGCAYGNVLLMLNGMLGKPADVRFVGVDLHDEGMRDGRAFAETVPGYSNCEYQVADLSKTLPFPDDTFDAINLGDVLEHMEDPGAALRELARVAKVGAVILVSTPLKDGLFKKLARFANWLSGGKVYKNYYKGKNTDLNEKGEPVMVTKAGHDHISELNYRQLRSLLGKEGFIIEKVEMMPVMSGSKWFDRHPFLLTAMMFIEAVHEVLRLSSWAHSVMILARVTPQSKGSVSKT